jgi:hypothetical protein
MRFLNLFLATLMLLTVSCNNRKNKQSTDIPYANLDLQKKWIEIPNRNTKYSPSSRTKDFNELQTIIFSKVQNRDAITVNDGYKTQSFEIKQITKQKDSLIFKVILPSDTTNLIYLSMKYDGRDKFVARWIINGKQGFYFPYKDTTGNNKVSY